MDRFRIEGPTRLTGEVEIAGAKNASLPALAATLLADEPLVLHRLPGVRDIQTMRPYVLGSRDHGRLWGPRVPVTAALETRAGLFEQLGIVPDRWSLAP